MGTVVRLVIGFAIAAALFGLLERLWPATPARRHFRQRRTDIGYWLFTPLFTKPLTRACLVVAAVLLAVASGVPLSGPAIREYLTTPRGLGALLPVGVQVLLVLVLGDLIAYGMHRAFHRGRLWAFHAVHHAANPLDWLAAPRLHPVNEALTRLAQLLPLALLGFQPGIVAAYAPFITLWAILLHANVPWTFGPFRFVIASPAFHRWHHTSEEEGRDRNFAGLFPFIDVAFGTFHMPPGRRPERFGVSDPVPAGLVGQLAYPFRARA